MTETLVCIRYLQQMSAFPVTVTPSAVGYIDIDILVIEVLVALFGAVVHRRDTPGQVGVGLYVIIHPMTGNENVVYPDIVIDVEVAGVQRKLTDVHISQTSAEMYWCFAFQTLKPLTDMLPRAYLPVSLFRYGILGDIHHSESVVRAVHNHHVFDNLMGFVYVIIHRIYLVGQTALYQSDNNDNGDDKSPWTYHRSDEYEFIGFSEKITHLLLLYGGQMYPEHRTHRPCIPHPATGYDMLPYPLRESLWQESEPQ